MKKNALIIALCIVISVMLVGCMDNNSIIKSNNNSSDNNPAPAGKVENVNNNTDESTSKDTSDSTNTELTNDTDVNINTTNTTGKKAVWKAELDKKDKNRYANITQNPIATIEMENGGIIKIELYPKIAPETVENFIELANSNFYDGVIFHRTIPKFMAQGGDPDGTGFGGPEYSIYGEFLSNGFENDLSHTRGVVSMARSQEPNSAGSQFFIVTDNSTFLNGDYAAFGKVLEGMDVADEIVNSEVIRRETTIDQNSIKTQEDYIEYITQYMECDRPINPPVIKTITVETFGVEYGSPVKIVE